MTGDSAYLLLLFWGVWLLAPALVDLSDTVRRAWIVWRNRELARPQTLPTIETLPTVSVIIPAYNEEVDIDLCLRGLKAQKYPQHLLEIIVVNDGSTDETDAVVYSHIDGPGRWTGGLRLHNRIIPSGDFGGVLRLVQGNHAGKPAAVNLGLARARGALIISLDADVVLEPEAIAQIAAAFLREPDLAAATAHLIIDSNLLVYVGADGRIQLDVGAVPLRKPMSLLERFLAAAQFLEYMTAFRIGRHAEAITGDLFTLSGACAIFRRTALEAAGGYRWRTVSEDTDATLAMHRKDWRIGYIPPARVHLAPIVSWNALYSQRVRWQRGALEVAAANADMIGSPGRFWRRSLPRRLQKVHSMAMLRLVWGFMLPLFPLFGYSGTVVAQAYLLLYALYVITEAIGLVVGYPISAPAERRLLHTAVFALPLMPFYRLATYFFRVSGMLRTLTEPPTWTASRGALDWLGFTLQTVQTSRPGQHVRDWARSFLRIWSN